MRVGGSGVYRLDQLPGGRARQMIQTTTKATLAEPKRGPNRIKPKKKRKK